MAINITSCIYFLVLTLPAISSDSSYLMSYGTNVCFSIEDYTDTEECNWFNNMVGSVSEIIDGEQVCPKIIQKSRKVYECCDGWKQKLSQSDSCTAAMCVLGWDRCPNGGTCIEPYLCSCQTGYYSPNCDRCTQIDNCQAVACTDQNDHKCIKCNYEHTPSVRAYKADDYSKRKCQQLCSWRDDSKQCYPGECTQGTPSSCKCATNFTSSNCMTISAKPDIMSCLASASDANGESVEIKCETVDVPTKYTNIEFNKLKVDWKSRYHGSSPQKPDYIQSYSVGVIEARVNWSIVRDSSKLGLGTKTLVNSGVINCDNGYSSDKPDTKVHDCYKYATFSESLQTGDRLEFTVEVKNGGYLKIHNYDSGPNSRKITTKYYNGMNAKHSTSFTFDNTPPVHCLTSCSSNMLDRGVPFTKQPTITLKWDGWSDGLAGVAYYEYEIYKLSKYGGDLDYKSDGLITSSKKHTSLPDPPPRFTLPKSGLYCILLIVTDNAGNYRLARRFVMFDNSSTLSHSSEKMFVASAASNTSHLWITTLNEQVKLQWKGLLQNDMHKVQGLLGSIANHTSTIEGSYEERTGQPHVTRSMQAIPNVNGIIRYDIAQRKDHEGGRSITTPLSFSKVLNFESEEISQTIPRADGDSIRFWIKGSDVMNQTFTEEVLVHVDSSPAIIENVGLDRNGHKALMVHNNLDLFKLNVEFDTYDYHSGIREIAWELHDMKHPSSIHGSGNLPSRRTSKSDVKCVAPDCYCIPKDNECFFRTYNIKPDMSMDKPSGNHDYDYYVLITVTNNALLNTTYIFQITVDSTPPLPGYVYDSPSGQTDRDYQADLTIHASWNGFFDRESGVMVYNYAILPYCLRKTDFENNTDVLKTNNTFAQTTVSRKGTYYTSVIAYNHALEPSLPVCSDGIMVDTTPPSISSVSIKNTFIRPGLVRDSNTALNYIDKFGNIYDLNGDIEECRKHATSMPNLHVLKTKKFKLPLKPHQDNCTFYKGAGKKMFSIKENLLSLSWEGSDAESSIFDYEVALGSTQTSNADIMPFTSTHGKKHFITYHPNLVNEGEFYISIKVINKAGMRKVESIGPIEVRILGPTFDASNLAIDYYELESSWYLLAKWNKNSWNEDDISDNFLSKVDFSLGEDQCSGNIQGWTKIDASYSFQDCTVSWPPTCLAISSNSFRFKLHREKTYCLSVRATGFNGLSNTKTVTYTHLKGIPSSGAVIEVNIKKQDQNYEDIDFQTDPSKLTVRYIGNILPDKVDYFIGVGTVSGEATTQTFKPVSMVKNKVIVLNGLQLNFFQKYYVTVKAVYKNNKAEYSLTSSDGITNLPESFSLNDFAVNDGISCRHNETEFQLLLNHHSSLENIPKCGEDIDYQPYPTALSAYWTNSFPGKFITNFKVHVEKQNASTQEWTQYGQLYNYGTVNEVVLSGVYLNGGIKYRLSVQPCHPVGCYKAVKTNGVTVLPSEPIAGKIIEAKYNKTDKSISLKWEIYQDPYLGADTSIVNQYQFALFVHHQGIRPEQISSWEAMPWSKMSVNLDQNKIHTDISLGKYSIEPSACLKIGLKGYNQAMLSAVKFVEVLGCDADSLVNLQVIDAVGRTNNDGLMSNIFLTENDVWPEPDREYTPTKSSLAAVWPKLRHGHFRWKVINGDAIQGSGENPTFFDFDCTSTAVLACGSTEKRFINVHDLQLEEGTRYHICIYSYDTTLEHEKWKENLEGVSACSNGIVVDTEPPLGGKVWIGNEQEHAHFQCDSFTLVIHWRGFIDTEIHGNTLHHSGIKTYYLAVGSSHGGIDVLDFEDVGLNNLKVLTDLSLVNGNSYYATIKAVDYVDHETTVTSLPVIIDNSPPSTDIKKLYMDSDILTSERTVNVFYQSGTFTDSDSGISSYYWCIGTPNTFCDVMDLTLLTTSTITLQLGQANFSDGQKYVIHIQAINGAGLRSSVTSDPFFVDTTPPNAGFVHDTVSGIVGDADFQTLRTILHVQWGGFSDSHSHIVEYSVSIGTTMDSNNVVNNVYAGLSTEYIVENLSLKLGETYYSRVTACNSAKLCTSITSDGILIDSTPPHIGKVKDGTHGPDIDYQSSGNIITAHIENMHDMQSGLSTLHWWAGTSVGAKDIFSDTLSHSHSILHRQLAENLAGGTKVYVTIRACNKAELCTTKSSDGVVIDSQAPVFNRNVSLSQKTGSIQANTQIYRNTMSLEWIVKDKESPINKVYISILSTTNVHFVHPTVKLLGNPTSYLFSNLSLGDGDVYHVKVIACNKAKLCSSSILESILVDSSQPKAGAFAIETDHAIELNRHRSSWMTYNNNPGGNSHIKLALVGFQDPHSGIATYSIKVGTTFHDTDLNRNNKGLIVSHQSNESHRDEGFIQKHVVEINKEIKPNDILFISVTATNGVGLISPMLNGEHEAIPSGNNKGTLTLNRRCRSVSCIGHCTCVPHGSHTCNQKRGDCIDKTGDQAYSAVSINDTIPSVKMDGRDTYYIPSEDILSAYWKPASTGKQPVWYDWSVGAGESEPGIGLFDTVTQPIWYEAGTRKSAIFSTSESNIADLTLKKREKYTFYVKAWYDDNSYAIYKSNGVLVDITPPELSKSYKVIETSNPASSRDENFINTKTTITIKWKYVFRDSQSRINYFNVQLYSDKNIKFIHKLSGIQGSQTNVTLKNLSLKEGKNYHAVVTACNKANLCSSDSSDGFVIDVSKPVAGIVYDGVGLHDIDYSSHNLMVSARWEGFFDEESFIDHYVWCVGTSPGKDDILECEKVGLYIKQKKVLSNPTKNGKTIYSTVYAINGAGISSNNISSNGVKIDTTPPQVINQFKMEENIVKYPSFEGTKVVMVSHWEIQSSTTDWLNPMKYACLSDGYIQQNLTVSTRQKYKCSFKVKSGTNSTYAVLGFVKFGKHDEKFSDGRTFNMDSDNFFSFHYYFNTGESSEVSLKLGTIEHGKQICFDDVEITKLSIADKNNKQSKYKNSVHIHIFASPLSTSLTLNWDFEDLESPIIDYMFAVGTVKGGVQLQDYKSTGTKTSATISNLVLSHRSKIFVSVVAYNAAGLSSVIYSDPVVVDLTPPVITKFNVNGGDLYLTTDDIEVEWYSKDPESGISKCEFLAGTTLISDDVVSKRNLAKEGKQTISMMKSLSHNDHIYCHLICASFSNHVTSKMIGPLTLISEAPSVEGSSLNIVPMSTTYYNSRHHYISNAKMVWLRMDAVQFGAEVDKCEINIKDGTTNILPWHVLGISQDNILLLGNGSVIFKEKTYSINVRCLNQGKLKSKMLTTNFTIEKNAPIYTGNPPKIFWPDNATVDIDWTGLFKSSSEMIFQVHIGTTIGGVDVLSWVETKEPKIIVKPVDSSKIYYVTITAISQSGLFTVESFEVKYG